MLHLSNGTRWVLRIGTTVTLTFIYVPLVVIGFAATRRKTAAGEHPATEDAEERARTEQEFADAEAFEAEWRKQDKERYRQEHLP